MQGGGQGPPGECGGVDPVDRRVAAQYRIEFCRQFPTTRCAPRLTACHPVRRYRIRTESGGDIPAGQLGELGEGPDTQAPQQIRELRTPRARQARLRRELSDRQSGQERRIRTGLHHPAGPGG